MPRIAKREEGRGHNAWSGRAGHGRSATSPRHGPVQRDHNQRTRRIARSLGHQHRVRRRRAYANVDAFSDALYTSANNNGIITSWVTNPSTAMALSKLKAGTALNSPLLQPDPTKPGQRQILGVPLLTSPAVPTANNQVWGIPAQFCYLVIRSGAEVISDSSVFFTSHRVALRAILRCGFGFPHPPSIVKISTT
jgi:HK97 family phage major capsid protein